MTFSKNRSPFFRIMLYHFAQPSERLVPAGRPWLATSMSPFPQHLLDGYRTFTSQRLPTEQSRYRELSERGQSPDVMVIGCCDSRVSPEGIFAAGPRQFFSSPTLPTPLPASPPTTRPPAASP